MLVRAWRSSVWLPSPSPCSQWTRLLEDAPAQEPVKTAICDNIRLASEQLPKFKGQCHLVKQASAGFKFNQEINITVRPVFTAHGRTKHPHVVRSIFGAEAQNVFPFFLQQRAQGHRPIPFTQSTHTGGCQPIGSDGSL